MGAMALIYLTKFEGGIEKNEEESYVSGSDIRHVTYHVPAYGD